MSNSVTLPPYRIVTVYTFGEAADQKLRADQVPRCSSGYKNLGTDYGSFIPPADSPNMKYSSFVAIFSLFVISAFAEIIQIGAPPDGTQVKPGKNIKVEVVQPVRFLVLSPPLIH